MFCDDALPLSHDLSPSEVFLDSAPPHHPNNVINLDDVWGFDPSSTDPSTSPSDVNHIRHEPSDIPRLRSEHSTSGYRDGVAAAKNTTIQKGFDEGYSLGAVIGLEVGVLLGVLEGIRNAIMDIGGEKALEKKRTNTLLEIARKELQTEHVFGRDWWGDDGTWTYEVIGKAPDGAEDYTFSEVANSHPVIKKWKAITKSEAEKWRLDLTMMERTEEKRAVSDGEG